jgi:hypothetical protein
MPDSIPPREPSPFTHRAGRADAGHGNDSLAGAIAAVLAWQEVSWASFDAQGGALQLDVGAVTVTASTTNPVAAQVPAMVALEPTMVHASAMAGRLVLFLESPTWSYAFEVVPASLRDRPHRRSH